MKERFYIKIAGKHNEYVSQGYRSKTVIHVHTAAGTRFARAFININQAMDYNRKYFIDGEIVKLPYEEKLSDKKIHA